MRISTVVKVAAAMTIIGSVSFPAFAEHYNEGTVCPVGQVCEEDGSRGDSNSVPEPGALGLLGLGLAGIIIARRRR